MSEPLRLLLDVTGTTGGKATVETVQATRRTPLTPREIQTDLGRDGSGDGGPVVDDLCEHCHVRPASIDWVGDGGVLDWAHGFSHRWCEHCAVEARLDFARQLAAEIPDLEAQLAKLP
jgi:hypothetical protein